MVWILMEMDKTDAKQPKARDDDGELNPKKKLRS